MKNRMTSILIVAAVLVVGGMAMFMLDSGSVSGDDSLVFGTFSKSMGNAPYHIAKHFKWFEEHAALQNKTISYVEFNDRATISQAFDRGDLDMLFSAEIPAIMCRAQGNDIRVVDIASTVELQFLARSDDKSTTDQNLRGKRIAVLGGTSSHFGLLNHLKKRGLTVEDINVEYKGPGAARVEFEQGALDVWVVWSPFIDEQLVNGRGRLVPETSYEITNTMAVPSRLVDGNDGTLRALVSTIERAKVWIVENPKRAQEILAAELNLEAAVVAEAFPKFDYSVRLNGVLEDFQNKSQFLADEGKTRKDQVVDVREDLVELRYAGEPANK